MQEPNLVVIDQQHLFVPLGRLYLMIKSLFWFYVGFVFVAFAFSLWLLLSSVLTITPIPLPYWLTYTPNNIASAGIIVLALTLALYTYLGIILVLHGLRRGLVPIIMVTLVIAGLALLLAKLAIQALVIMVIAYTLLVGTYGVLATVALTKTAKALWVVGVLILVFLPLIFLSGGLAVINYVRYMAFIGQAMAIMASAIEARALSVK
jgi:hypothetical protein